MTTRALAAFGVYGRPHDELAILDLADEFRGTLCTLYQARHEAIIDFRNYTFPALWSALQEWERCIAKIAEVERAIKAHHSDVRDRNALPLELEQQLKQLRGRRAVAQADLRNRRAEWSDFLKRFKAWFREQADWKNVKTLEKRRGLYDGLQWPDEFADYGRQELSSDLAIRELDKQFSQRGLSFAIRAEIREATDPKIGKDGPGMRYVYGRSPEPQPWRKLSLHFGGGGLPVAKLFDGSCPSLSLTPEASREREWNGRRYRATMQCGTEKVPHEVSFAMTLDKPIPADAKLMRWSLCVREGGKREVVPILSNLDGQKPTGTGTFAYDIHWTVRNAGVEVCSLWGPHVNERVVVPAWLVRRRTALAEASQLADATANELLAANGEAVSKRKGRQGVDALVSYCQKFPENLAASNVLANLQDQQDRAKRVAQRAARCIEKIYETVAYRVCSRHAAVVHDTLSLARVKRYKSRDLLAEDKIPLESRATLFAVAPGKLVALFKGYGLLASDEVVPKLPDDARESDLFTTWVDSLAVMTGRRGDVKHDRSRKQLADIGG